MPLPRISSRTSLALIIGAGLSCASGRGTERDAVDAQRDAQINELRAELVAQADRIKAQEHRIEGLELHLAAVSARPPAPDAAPGDAAPSSRPNKTSESSDKPPPMQTVKLHPQSGRVRVRPPRQNPVERAPHLPSTVELKEPDGERLAELDQPLPPDPISRDHQTADHAFAQAVQQLNAGDYLSAQTAFLLFATRWPRDASADNAVYYAGLARAASGDCAGALGQFDRVIRDYPAGDARAPARLEKGRCLLILGRRDDGRAMLQGLLDDGVGGLEAQQARALLSSDSAAAEGAAPNR